MTAMGTHTPFTLDRVVRLTIALALLAGAMWLVITIRGVLLPFLVACLIAYMFEPFVQYNRRLLKLRGRSVAVFITLFEASLLTGIVLWFLVPTIFEEMQQMAEVMKRYANARMSIRYLPDSLHDLIRRHVNFEEVSRMLSRQEWMDLIENTLATAWSVLTGSISVLLSIFNWLVVVLYVIFIMLDYDRLGRAMRSLVPVRYRRTAVGIGSDIKRSMNHYFRGQALIALTVGIMFCIGFSMVGLPMAIALGLFIGILNMVPYLQLISFIPTTLLCIIYAVGGGGDFWVIFAQCFAVYAVVQVIQDLILTPHIMGKAMGLNPAIILFSLSVWGTLMGFVGLIIALPLTTLILSYYRRFVIDRGDSSHNLPRRRAHADHTMDEMEDSI